MFIVGDGKDELGWEDFKLGNFFWKIDLEKVVQRKILVFKYRICGYWVVGLQKEGLW